MMSPETDDQLAEARRYMVQSHLRARGISDERVLAAMARVPRHEFVSKDLWPRAYDDHPLPIAEGQTISQPYMVAIMLQALALGPSEVVLEVGTGSGYQAALLAELSLRVYSVERHESLARQAATALARLQYTNVSVVVGDGSKGLPEHAPFDAIIVAAAAPQVPQPLIEQLREDGRMVVPVGPPEVQQLLLVRKRQGAVNIFYLEGCRFVPLVVGEVFSAKQ